MKKMPILSLCLLALGLVSCSSIARKVLIRPGQGGIVAIPDAEAGRGKAESIMDDVCHGKKVHIVEEVETPIASVVEKDTDKVGGTTLSPQSPTHYDASVKHSREEFSSKNEWRITFQCQ